MLPFHQQLINKRWASIPFHRILLALLFFMIYVVPFFPPIYFRYVYHFFFTAIILTSVFVLEKTTKFHVIIALAVVLLKWSILLYNGELRNISNIPQMLFFLYVVVSILSQIANSRYRKGHIIVVCINGYLLSVLVCALLLAITIQFQPGSFNFRGLDAIPVQGTNEFIYHAIVVFSTTGFGDIIAVTPQAKAVSNFISVAGQLYVAIIITLLINNYKVSSQANES